MLAIRISKSALGCRIVGRPLDAQQTQIGLLDDVVGVRHAAQDANHIRAKRGRGAAVARVKRLLVHRAGCIRLTQDASGGDWLGGHLLECHLLERDLLTGLDVRRSPEVCRLEDAQTPAQAVGRPGCEQEPDAQRQQDHAGDGENV